MAENPAPKSEKNEAPGPAASDGMTWGKALKLGAIGAVSTAVGTGIERGIEALVERAVRDKVAGEPVRKAAAFGRALKSVFAR
jgi:hypothetical protein